MKKQSIFYNTFLIILSIILFSCSDGTDMSVPQGNTGGTGKAGSLARFAGTHTHLYALEGNDLYVFNIENSNEPDKIKEINVGEGIETIFIRNNVLFIGANDGMYIYDISNPSTPLFRSVYRHVFACDPVVADDNYAYVTLRSEADRSVCRFNNINQLEIIDISDLTNPFQIAEYEMTHPKGLSLNESRNILFLCNEGLSVYDISNVNQIILLQHFDIVAHDVISLDEIILVVGKSGFYLYKYDYENNKIQYLSHIPVSIS